MLDRILPRLIILPFFPIENNRLSGDVPSGTGRLCEWREDPQQPADRFSSFGAYQVNVLFTLIYVICLFTFLSCVCLHFKQVF